ncbi:MAG: lysophospholipase [Alphaproteobacteria bacterium]
MSLLLAACAPQLQPPGDGLEPSRASVDAFVTVDGYRLPMRIALPANSRIGAVIIAVHGFNDYSNAFAASAETWRKQGIAVYAYDQRGFGRTVNRGLWPGDDRLLADLVEVTQHVRARHPDVPIYHLGESMGAAVVLSALAEARLTDSAGAILVAPAVWGREFLPWEYNLVGWFGAHTIPWYTLTGRGFNRIASDNIAMLRANGRDPLFIKETRVDAVYGLVNLMDRATEAARRFKGRALILIGARDELVPAESIQAMLRRLPDETAGLRRVAIYPRGYHMLLRDLQGPVVQHDVAAWIRQPVAPLPSGADAKPWWLSAPPRAAAN